MSRVKSKSLQAIHGLLSRPITLRLFTKRKSRIYVFLFTNIAPEEMKDLQFGKMEASSDIKSSEAFSIGLTILDAALLQNS